MSSGFHCYGFVVCTMCFRTIACIMCLKCTLHLAAVFYFLSTESRKCEKSLQNDQDLSEIMCRGCLCKVTGQVKIFFLKMVSWMILVYPARQLVTCYFFGTSFAWTIICLELYSNSFSNPLKVIYSFCIKTTVRNLSIPVFDYIRGISHKSYPCDAHSVCLTSHTEIP